MTELDNRFKSLNESKAALENLLDQSLAEDDLKRLDKLDFNANIEIYLEIYIYTHTSRPIYLS